MAKQTLFMMRVDILEIGFYSWKEKLGSTRYNIGKYELIAKEQGGQQGERLLRGNIRDKEGST